MNKNMYFKVLFEDEVFRKRNGNIESNCNQIVFENLTAANFQVNEKILAPGESYSFPEGSPHPLEYIATKFVIKFNANKNPRLRVQRKYVTIIDKPLPNKSVEL